MRRLAASVSAVAVLCLVIFVVHEEGPQIDVVHEEIVTSEPSPSKIQSGKVEATQGSRMSVHHRQRDKPQPQKAPVPEKIPEKAQSEKSHQSRYAELTQDESKLRQRIAKALKVSARSLARAHTSKEKKAAKWALVRALRTAGVADAEHAGVIAWTNRELNAAKRWAAKSLKHDAAALDEVEAWVAGDHKTGTKMQRKTEIAIEVMVELIGKVKNKETLASNAKRRIQQRLDFFDTPIENARKAATYAKKSVVSARAALAATIDMKARHGARIALRKAQNALRDANKILQLEIKKKDHIAHKHLLAARERLVGINELHLQATRTFHRAHRIMKFVRAAVIHARRNHDAHKEAMTKRTEKMAMEKTAKAAYKETEVKGVIKRRHKAIKAQEAYASNLQNQVLQFAELARDSAKKAAAAGRIAAQKALESARVSKRLGKATKDASAPTMEALARQNIAALLAEKAAKMEDAIVSGGHIPKQVEDLIMDDAGIKLRPSVRKAAQGVLLSHAHIEHDMEGDFHAFKKDRKAWSEHYRKLYRDPVT